MAWKKIDDTKLTAIADAIRGKTGGTDEITLDAMPTEIAAIETGGESVAFPTVTIKFYNFDTVVWHTDAGGEMRRSYADGYSEAGRSLTIARNTIFYFQDPYLFLTLSEGIVSIADLGEGVFYATADGTITYDN